MTEHEGHEGPERPKKRKRRVVLVHHGDEGACCKEHHLLTGSGEPLHEALETALVGRARTYVESAHSPAVVERAVAAAAGAAIEEAA